MDGWTGLLVPLRFEICLVIPFGTTHQVRLFTCWIFVYHWNYRSLSCTNCRRHCGWKSGLQTDQRPEFFKRPFEAPKSSQFPYAHLLKRPFLPVHVCLKPGTEDIFCPLFVSPFLLDRFFRLPTRLHISWIWVKVGHKKVFLLQLADI